MRILKLTFAVTLALGLLFSLGVLVTLRPVEAAPAGVIQSMIDNAPNGGTVNIPAGTYNESLTVNKTLTLTGVSSGTTIIQAVTGQRVITVTDGNNLRLENLAVTGGQAPGQGGGGIAIISGSLTLANCRIANNSANYGGGVYQGGNGGRVDVINSRIELNTTSNHGGGLYVNGSAALTNAQVLSNTATWHAGGLHVQSGRVDLIGGLFSNNRALNGNGGAVNLNGSINISGTQFISNTALNGGGLQQWNTGRNVLITNTRFERNVARGIGGGAAISSTLVIINSTFATNTVDSGNSNNTYGGGLYVDSPSQILASTFVSNSTRCAACPFWYGGGMYTPQSAMIQDSTFDRNDAYLGGGVYGNLATISVTRSTFKNNTAGYGGAIDAYTIQATGSSFLSNRASNAGGGVRGTSIMLSGMRFISNTAGFAGGGGIWVLVSLDAVNTLFVDNQAYWGGAVIDSGASTVILRHVTIGGATLRSMPAIRMNNGTVLITNTIMSSYTVGISQTLGLLSIDYDLLSLPVIAESNGGTFNWGLHTWPADPRFVNPGLGDYHLAADSSAIDNGTDLGVTMDLDGVKRPIGKGYDVGAYEAKLHIYLPLILRN